MQEESRTVTAAPDGIHHRLRTLVADDSAVFRSTLCRLLQHDPLVEIIGTAGSGEDAMRLALKLKPDLVLMDLNMPCVDGLEATAQLRSRLPDTRIIIMTAGEVTAAQTAARHHGAHGFAAKPLLHRVLLAEIRRVFEQDSGDGRIPR